MVWISDADKGLRYIKRCRHDESDGKLPYEIWSDLKEGRPVASIPVPLRFLMIADPKIGDVFLGWAGVLVVSERMHDLLRGFDLGTTQFFEADLLTRRELRVAGRFFVVNVCEWKNTLLPERSKLRSCPPHKRGTVFAYAGSFPRDREIALVPEARTGVDLWREIRLRNGLLVSDRLAEACRAAGIRPFTLRRVEIVDGAVLPEPEPAPAPPTGPVTRLLQVVRDTPEPPEETAPTPVADHGPRLRELAATLAALRARSPHEDLLTLHDALITVARPGVAVRASGAIGSLLDAQCRDLEARLRKAGRLRPDFDELIPASQHRVLRAELDLEARRRRSAHRRKYRARDHAADAARFAPLFTYEAVTETAERVLWGTERVIKRTISFPSEAHLWPGDKNAAQALAPDALTVYFSYREGKLDRAADGLEQLNGALTWGWGERISIMAVRAAFLMRTHANGVGLPELGTSAAGFAAAIGSSMKGEIEAHAVLDRTIAYAEALAGLHHPSRDGSLVAAFLRHAIDRDGPFGPLGAFDELAELFGATLRAED